MGFHPSDYYTIVKEPSVGTPVLSFKLVNTQGRSDRGGGGAVDGVAGHPRFTCSFVHDTIGVGLSLLTSHLP